MCGYDEGNDEGLNTMRETVSASRGYLTAVWRAKYEGAAIREQAGTKKQACAPVAGGEQVVMELGPQRRAGVVICTDADSNVTTVSFRPAKRSA